MWGSLLKIVGGPLIGKAINKGAGLIQQRQANKHNVEMQYAKNLGGWKTAYVLIMALWPFMYAAVAPLEGLWYLIWWWIVDGGIFLYNLFPYVENIPYPERLTAPYDIVRSTMSYAGFAMGVEVYSNLGDYKELLMIVFGSGIIGGVAHKMSKTRHGATVMKNPTTRPTSPRRPNLNK